MCVAILAQAQVSKTVNVTAGGLSSALTITEKTTVTNLTISGTIDARDFKTMRDNMPVLAVLDISNVTISEYTGTEGTSTANTSYVINFIPNNAFYNSDTYVYKESLTSIALPSSVTGIGLNAFKHCIGLTSFVIPSSVTIIGDAAFTFCSGLKSITIPSSVTLIPSDAFSYCTGLVTITIPSSVTAIGVSAFMSCSGIQSVTLPSSVISIGLSAFHGCSALSSVVIPSSVITIESAAFYGCSRLNSIYVYSSYPINLSSSGGVFQEVNKSNCTLYVPYKSAMLYAAANEWKGFTNIIEETKGFLVSSTDAKLAADKGSNAKVDITANVPWTSSADQPWLTVSPTSDTGNNTIAFTAEANTSNIARKATVTFSGTGVASQYITVTQDGFLPTHATINNNAGGLSTALPLGRSMITELTITGIIDARDFKNIRESMPALAVLDLSGVTISEYNGTAGTSSLTQNYPANAIPQDAFWYKLPTQYWTSKVSLSKIIFPLSVTSVESGAFYNCTGLTSVSIPPSVTTIWDDAFAFCTGLTSVTIPSSVLYLSEYAFRGSSGLITVESENQNYSSLDGVLFNKTQTNLKICPTSKTGSYNIPPSVTSIWEYAFYNCINLTSVIIPSSVTDLGDNSFYNCSSLSSIYVCSSNPVVLGFFHANIFYNVNKTTCTLYVPIGSKNAYQTAERWKDFNNIVEFWTVDIEPVNKNEINIYPNPVTDGFRVNGIKEPSTISVFDINGGLLLTKLVDSNEYISLSSLSQGVYMVKISSKAETFETKLVKK